MNCRTVTDQAGNVVAIACGRGQRRKCSTPGCRGEGTRQCDYPVKRGEAAGTCDRYLCAACAVRVGPDRDHCPVHARAGGRRAPARGADAGAPRSLEGVTARIDSGTILTPKRRV